MSNYKNAKSEQITLNGQLVFEHDVKMYRPEIRLIYKSIFGNSYKEEIICGKKVDVVSNNNKRFFLLTSQITYLGNPWPTYKKRVQLKNWFKFIYDDFNNDSSVDIRLIGIYRYGSQIVFVDFDKAPYFSRKMHNSSAHVYTNDLYQGIVHGVFSKRDIKNNLITSIRKNNFKNYLFGSTAQPQNFENEILEKIDCFNKTQNIFNDWICVHQAIREMRDANFKKWKEGEWAGFFVEYLYDKFIKDENIKTIMEYINNKDSQSRDLDFDLFFSKANFYGDLKSSDIVKKDTMLNDKGNVIYELKHFKKLWYIIYEHETIKDKDIPGHPYTAKRLEVIREVDPTYKIGHDDTYLSRLKAKVKYKKMFIVEINSINYSSLLEEMTSNFHLPDGVTKREPKFKLTKTNIQNAIIYSFVA